jgi:hypothetical protein
MIQLALQESAIRERAYSIWEEEGRPEGRAWDHWDRASREIVERMITPPSIGEPADQPIAPAKAKPRKRIFGKSKTRQPA